MISQDNRKSRINVSAIFIAVLVLGFLSIGFYNEIIRSNQLLEQVQIDFITTKKSLGEPSPYVLTKKDCDKFQFITCQEMSNKNVEIIYHWSKGLDMNIVAGFDKDDKLQFKKIVINEQLSLKE